MEIFVWEKTALSVKGGWRYATTPAGAMSVMMIGIIQMPRLPAENLAFLVHVSSNSLL